MRLRNDGEVSEFAPGNPGLGHTTGPISSLQEVWFHTLDRCGADVPLGEVIFPLMRNCFFGGAMHAVYLLQDGHGDHLASVIAGFITEEPESCTFAQEQQGIFHRTGIGHDHSLFDVATATSSPPLIDCRRFEPVPDEELRRRLTAWPSF
jgi:hypothetical protein